MSVSIDSGDFPSAKGKIKGDLDRVIGKWQTKISGGFNEGAVWLLRAIEEVDDLELWKTYWGGGFDFNESREAFIQRKLLVDFDIVEDTLPAILAKLHAGEPVELTRKDGEAVQLAFSTSPASEAQKGNRNAVKGKENDSPNLANGYSPQQDRANANGISVAHQRTLDKIARLAPDYLPRIAAKEISINKAVVPGIALGVRDWEPHHAIFGLMRLGLGGGGCLACCSGGL